MKRISFRSIMEAAKKANISEKIETLMKGSKGTPVPISAIKKQYLKEGRNLTVEFKCPNCGEDTVLFNYGNAWIRNQAAIQTNCCSGIVYFPEAYTSDYGGQVVYGCKMTIDNRNCEVLYIVNRGDRKKSSNYINMVICADVDNFKKYSYLFKGYDVSFDEIDLESELKTNRCPNLDYGEAIMYFQSDDGENFQMFDKDVNKIYRKHVGYYARVNLTDKLDKEIETHKQSRPCSKQRKPKDWEKVLSSQSLIKKVRGDIERIKEEVIERTLTSIPIYINPKEIDEMEENHIFEGKCPKCGNSHIFTNKKNIMLSKCKSKYSKDIFEGFSEETCSCGFSFKGHLISEQRYYHNPYYIYEDYSNVYDIKWYFYETTSYVNNQESYIIPKKDTDYIYQIIDSTQEYEKRYENYKKLYDYENHSDIDIKHQLIKISYDGLTASLNETYGSYVRNDPEIFIMNNVSELKYAQLDQVGSGILLIAYICAYLKKSIIETVLKTQPYILPLAIKRVLGTGILAFSGITDEIKTVEDIFNLNRFYYKMFRKLNLIDGYDRLLHHLLVLLTRKNEIAKEEDVKFIVENQIPYNYVENVFEELPNATLSEIVGYLKHCKQYQCIPPNHAITFWYDYIRMSKLIGVDMADKKARRPRSLKMEHDIVTYKANIIKAEQSAQLFEAAVKKNKKYEYKGKLLFIKIPDNIEELFEEGRKLNHCVGTYGERIIEGRSNIFFIRWNEKPDSPYFTLEMINNHLTQIYGYGDRSVDRLKDKDLRDFLRTWAKKFGFADDTHSI